MSADAGSLEALGSRRGKRKTAAADGQREGAETKLFRGIFAFMFRTSL